MPKMPPKITVGNPRISPNIRYYQLNVPLTDKTYSWSRGRKPPTDVRIQYIADYLMGLAFLGSFTISGSIISVRKWHGTWDEIDPVILEGIRRHMGWRSTPVLLWLRRIIERTKTFIRWLHAKWLEYTDAPVRVNYVEDFSPVRAEAPIAA